MQPSLGADTVRAYLMFLGPWDQGGDWDDSGINGVSRWLNRVWNMVTDGYKPGVAVGQGDAATTLRRLMHQTIKKATQDIERIRFNTMIAALMEYTNYLIKVKEAGSVEKEVWDESVRALLLLLAPSTPHLAEELWQQIGQEYSVHNQEWPEWDEGLAKEEEITLVVQVNGKIRDKVAVPASISEDEAREMAAQQPKARAYLAGKDVVKAIYVPGKLVNFVVK